LVAGRLTVPNIESRCNQLKLGHPLLSFSTHLLITICQSLPRLA
jgi:hypothetical protein